jgi:hypothetical protein
MSNISNTADKLRIVMLQCTAMYINLAEWCCMFLNNKKQLTFMVFNRPIVVDEYYLS